MKDQFKRILELVRKTGDTMVVTDTNGKDVYVVMDLDHYESMVDAVSVFDQFEDESSFQDEVQPPLESIEPPKKEEWEIPEEFIIDDPEGGLADEPISINSSSDADIWSTMQPANETGPTWDVSQMNSDEIADLEKQYKVFAEKSVQKVINEESVEKPQQSQKPTSDEFSEEEFYLEPIE